MDSMFLALNIWHNELRIIRFWMNCSGDHSYHRKNLYSWIDVFGPCLYIEFIYYEGPSKGDFVMLFPMILDEIMCMENLSLITT